MLIKCLTFDRQQPLKLESHLLLVDMLRVLKWPTTALFRASMPFDMDDPNKFLSKETSCIHI